MSNSWPGGALPAGYAAQDVLRLYAEPPKSSHRSDFARDRARVVHSSALRRLAFKTQVLDPATDDFIRNRLTHSLEVAQIGRELAAAIGCDPDVVETACLAHDLGHPPFGHNGESALAELAADIGGFEGNAQTLRLLMRLEPKVFSDEGAAGGLNLTRAVLDASTKYPWLPGAGPDAAGKKFGAYPADAHLLEWVRQDAPGQAPHQRCIEAQVMDIADDVAYSVHDVEDAIVGGFVNVSELDTPENLTAITGWIRLWYLPDITDAEAEQGIARLRAMRTWVKSFTGLGSELAALKNFSSEAIGRFLTSVYEATHERHPQAPLTRYAGELSIPRSTLVEIAILKGIAAQFVMTIDDRSPVYTHQQRVVRDVVEALLERGHTELEPHFAEAWRECEGADDRLRVVIDQVASLTDHSVTAWHNRLIRS